VARVAAVASTEQLSQLKQVHTLVNNDKTDLLQSLLTQTWITLALLRRFGEGDQLAGRTTSPDDIAAVRNAEKSINRLETVLAERGVQLLLAEKEANEI
jgi:hypothetical protein